MAAVIPRHSDQVPPDGSLADLDAAAQSCRDCPIGRYATQAVFGVGPTRARLVLVGEQPGDREDLQGKPFVGPAGHLLDLALERLQWPRDAIYLTNAVKHFKFVMRGKRRLHKTPAQREVDICLQWLERELALIEPEAIVALGATAARALAGRPVGVLRERGQWIAGRHGHKVLVTLHPSALLRGPPEERDRAFEQWLQDLHAATRYAKKP